MGAREFTMSDETMLHATAALLAKYGWTMFPAPAGEKKSYKSARFSNGVQWGKTRDPDEVRHDFERWRDADIGVPTGEDNGFLVVEGDIKDGIDGVANFKKLIEENGGSIDTLMARSPTGSTHWFFAWPKGCVIRNSTSAIAPNVDVRGEGGMVIVPPSSHKSGGTREWLNDAPIAPLPQWLLEKLLATSHRPASAARAPATRPSANVNEVLTATAVTPNEDEDWETFNTHGMAIFAACDGGDDGEDIFHVWSSKSAKYDPNDTAAKWQKFHSCPPNLITAKSVFFWADQACPKWRSLVRPREGTIEEQMKAVAEEALQLPPLALDDFFAYMPAHDYIFIPTRDHWPAASVNSQLPLVVDGDKTMKPSVWLAKYRAVAQKSWAPGLPMLIKDRIVNDGNWIDRKGTDTFNLYMPPTIELGDPTKAGPWIELVHKVYPDAADRIIDYFAHVKQKPEVKINHGKVLGGKPGIGKDTIIEPLRQAVGISNFSDVSPTKIMGRFKGFLKCTVLRISEVCDLGEATRYSFYETMKTVLATPPEMHHIDEKFTQEYYVVNCGGTVMTTNRGMDGIYLEADDRRHDVIWSEIESKDFEPGYWDKVWHWYQHERGFNHVAAFLATRDITAFDPKAPPPKTEMFWRIVGANRPPEDVELADAIDKLPNFDLDSGIEISRPLTNGSGEQPEPVNPPALTVDQIKSVPHLGSGLGAWLDDRKNNRSFPHRLDKCGYVAIRNPDRKDGCWLIGKKRQVVYARKDLLPVDQYKAAAALQKKIEKDAARYEYR